MGEIKKFNEIKKKKEKEYNNYITERILLKGEYNSGKISLQEYAAAMKVLDDDPRGNRSS